MKLYEYLIKKCPITFLTVALLLITNSAPVLGVFNYGEGEILGIACYHATSSITFDCNASTTGWACTCSSVPALGSFSTCVYQHADVVESSFIKSAFGIAIQNCPLYGVDITYDDLNSAYVNSSKYLLDSSDSTFNATDVHYSPVSISNKTENLYARVYKTYYNEYDKGDYYGGIILAYWGLVLIVSSILTFLRKVFPRFMMSTQNETVNLFRKYITLPATGRKRHIGSLGNIMLVPIRAHTIILIGYLILLIVLTACNYDILQLTDEEKITAKFIPKVNFSTKPLMIQKFVGDRTGILSFAHLPLIFLFAGRNNFLLWLTGIKFESFIVFHKWIARGMTAQALIHSICYVFIVLENNEYNVLGILAQTQRFRFAITAMVLGIIIVVQALYKYRIKRYEVFKIMHAVLAALFLVACFYHSRLFGWLEYLYVSIGIWLFDHLIRVTRLLWFGITTKASFQLYEKEQMVRITIKRPSSWKPSPGSFVYIYIMRHNCFWQSHPFTIMSAYDKNDKDIVICFKMKGGMTKKIGEYLAKQPNHFASLNVLIEGPYGSRAPLEKYDSALILTAGCGIPTGICNAEALSKRQVGDQRIVLVWVIRHLSSFGWIYKELERLNSSKITTNIYVTRENETPSSNISFNDDSSSTEKGFHHGDKSSTGKDTKDFENISLSSDSSNIWHTMEDTFPYINLIKGRPNLDEMVRGEFKVSAGSVGIVTCGPDYFSDTIRNSVAKHLSECKGRVDLFEEIQTW